METADGSDGFDTNAQTREGQAWTPFDHVSPCLSMSLHISPSAKQHKRKANVPG